MTNEKAVDLNVGIVLASISKILPIAVVASEVENWLEQEYPTDCIETISRLNMWQSKVESGKIKLMHIVSKSGKFFGLYYDLELNHFTLMFEKPGSSDDGWTYLPIRKWEILAEELNEY